MKVLIQITGLLRKNYNYGTVVVFLFYPIFFGIVGSSIIFYMCLIPSQSPIIDMKFIINNYFTLHCNFPFIANDYVIFYFYRNLI